MEIPPLSQRPITDEEEEAFLQSTQPRRGLFTRRSWGLGTTHRPRSKNTKENKTGTGFTAFDTTHNTTRTGGGLASWLRADPIDWGIRALIILLAIGALVAVYIQGEARGWWHQGTAPTAAPTRSAMSGGAPTPAPTGSGEAVMSGGYEIGPDDILVRPQEHAASTYTLPTLPQTATENTERGAEAAAEHYLALLTYAWNTGNTKPLTDMSDNSDDFHQKFVSNIRDVYSNGWTFDNRSSVDRILRVNPVEPNGADVPPNTIAVAFLTTSSEGTTCRGQKIVTNNSEYQTVLALLMTWQDNKWLVTQGTAVKPDA